MNHQTETFEILKRLGAGEFVHLNGSLIDHLNGTKSLLKKWGASATLQTAGLFHAAYGTDGFDLSMVGHIDRHHLINLIGADAEEIVYQYAACDRKYVFEQLSGETNPRFRNRFEDIVYQLSEDQLRFFCELTAANEIEIAINRSEFVQAHSKDLKALFLSMSPFLSKAARESINSVLR